jgi:phage gp45-like
MSEQGLRLVRLTVTEIDNSGSQQKIKARGLANDIYEDVVRFEGHGASSVPPVGSEGWGIVWGNSDRVFALGFEDRAARPSDTPAGGIKLYCGGSASITLDGGGIAINGNVTITGTVICNGKIIDERHTHGNVQPGGGVSGAVT